MLTVVIDLESWKFLTLTVRSIHNRELDKSPGDYDQLVPFMIDYEAKQASEAATDGVSKQYLDRVSRYYYETGLGMVDHENESYGKPWWSRNTTAAVSDSVISSEELASKQQEEVMDYSCKSELGKPKQADCEQLIYSQLGQAQDSDILIGPGHPHNYILGKVDDIFDCCV